jgi:hypothetical protein
MGSALISRRGFLQQVAVAGLVLPAVGPPSYSQKLQSNSGGWTVFTPSADTQIVYVSSSTGNDRTGVVGDINHPFKTLAAGKARLRNGKPDWLLLKKGDTWTDEQFGYLRIKGRSAAEPMLFGAYGTGARPVLKINSRIGEAGIGGYYSSTPADYIALVGLDFYAHTRDPSSPTFNVGTLSREIAGFSWRAPYNWILIEDCRTRFTTGNISFRGVNFKMRRNVITDSYSVVGHAGGLYISGVQNPYFEENVWDLNGWFPGIKGAERTIFSRNLYIQIDCGPATILRDIHTNSASEGLQFRTGGTMDDCLFALNTTGFDVGHQKSDPDGSIVVHTADVTNNVIMQSTDLVLGVDPRGSGIVMRQCQGSGTGIHVTNNIIAHLFPGAGKYGGGIELDRDCSNCFVQNNIIFDWKNRDSQAENFGIIDHGSSNTIAPNDVDLNASNNNPSGAAPHEPFPDPSRTVGSYFNSIGGSPATTAGFLAAARLQSKDNWNPALLASAVNNYIRAGFGR